MPAQADSTEGFSPVADYVIGSGSGDAQALIGGGSSNAVAIADCGRCMYAGLGDKQPLMIASKSEVIGMDIVANSKTAWAGPFEVGWRS